MQLRKVRALKDTYGHDITGDLVIMAKDTVHIIRASDIEYYQARSTQFLLFPDAEIATYAFDSNGVDIGFYTKDGSIRLYSTFGTPGATVNLPDASLLSRANHTGTQAISTVLGLTQALLEKLPASAPLFVRNSQVVTVPTDTQMLFRKRIKFEGTGRMVFGANSILVQI